MFGIIEKLKRRHLGKRPAKSRQMVGFVNWETAKTGVLLVAKEDVAPVVEADKKVAELRSAEARNEAEKKLQDAEHAFTRASNKLKDGQQSILNGANKLFSGFEVVISS